MQVKEIKTRSADTPRRYFALILGSSLALSGLVQFVPGIGASAAPFADGYAVVGGNNLGEFGLGTRDPAPEIAVGTLDPAVTTGEVSYTSLVNRRVAVNESGELYGWGSNVGGVLGLGEERSITSPRRIDMAGTAADGQRIIDVALTSTNGIALAANGALVGWGNNDFGQLGAGSDSVVSTLPIDVAVAGTALEGKTVKRVFSVDRTMLAQADDGALFGWGKGARLGLEHDVSTPTAIDLSGTPLAGKRIAQITDLGVGRTEDGLAFILNRDASEFFAPISALAGKRIVSVESGLSHTYALTDQGEAYSWGANRAGQLGDGTTISRDTPRKIELDGPVKTISAGGGHGVAFLQNGRVATWGNNDLGALGDGTTVRQSSPLYLDFSQTALAGMTVTGASAGASSTFFSFTPKHVVVPVSITAPAAGESSQRRPLISGNGEPGALISVFVGDLALGEAIVSPDGTWNLGLENDLALGEHTIRAVQDVDSTEDSVVFFLVDSAGNNDPGESSEPTPTPSVTPGASEQDPQDPQSSQLATTGAEISTVLLIAILTALFGGCAIAAARRYQA